LKKRKIVVGKISYYRGLPLKDKQHLLPPLARGVSFTISHFVQQNKANGKKLSINLIYQLINTMICEESMPNFSTKEQFIVCQKASYFFVIKSYF
jgi:hypothetical protein